MHWLYYDQQSPATLEAAGAPYDSTFGYNETVGYRAGTTQVYRPLDANQLLELPLHIMDTALFYPSHLALSESQAKKLLAPMLDNAVRLGGSLTINWHDRSLAPERLWGRAYNELLDVIESTGAWFGTATDAVEWFRWRRSITFTCDNDGVVTIAASPLRLGLPGASVMVRRPAPAVEDERALGGSQILRISL
jgi:hypothetical protein